MATGVTPPRPPMMRRSPDPTVASRSSTVLVNVLGVKATAPGVSTLYWEPKPRTFTLPSAECLIHCRWVRVKGRSSSSPAMMYWRSSGPSS